MSPAALRNGWTAASPAPSSALRDPAESRSIAETMGVAPDVEAGHDPAPAARGAIHTLRQPRFGQFPAARAAASYDGNRWDIIRTATVRVRSWLSR